MSEIPTPEAATPDKTKRLEEIARMAALLTDRLLENQIMGRPVSKEGIRALLEASSLLKDHGHAIPPLLSQIVQDFGDEEASELPERQDDAEPDGAERLAWSLRPFKGSDDQER